MTKLKQLLIASCTASILFSAGNASAVSPANSAAFYQIATQVQYWKAVGNDVMAALTCNQFLTVQLPDPDDPTAASDRLFLQQQCAALVAGNPKSPGGNWSIGIWG